MNGWKNKKFGYRRSFYLLSVFYVVELIFLIILLNRVPRIYYDMNKQHDVEVKNKLHELIQDKEEDELNKELDKMVTDGILDVVILQEDQVIYQSKPTTDFTELNDYINKKKVNLAEAYEIALKGEDYQIWLAVYNVDSVQFFSVLLGIIGSGILILCVISAVLYQIMFRRLIKPVRTLKERISGLKDYRLTSKGREKIQSEYNVLSKELDEFAEDLDDKLKTINSEYTSLEYKLEAAAEQEQLKQQMIISLIHSLKSPLNISQIACEQGKHTEDPEELRQMLEHISTGNDKVLKSVNEILQIMNGGKTRDYYAKEEVDLVRSTREVVNSFRLILNENKIIFILEAPKELYYFINPLVYRQILNNVISNAAKYTDEKGEFELRLYEDHGQIFIEAYNDKADLNAIDDERVFDAFYRIDHRDHYYSSGVGLYAVNNLVESCGGRCTFEKQKGRVKLTIVMPGEEGIV